MNVWTLGAKVADLDREIDFVESLGGRLVLDDQIPFQGQTYRIPLVHLGDTYLHLATEMVYEPLLETPLPDGLCHVVFQVDDVRAMRDRAIRAGATEIAPISRITAGFGTRDVAFLRSPGGVLIEFVHILEAGVPSPR